MKQNMTIQKSMVETVKEAINVPFKELKVSEGLSFIIFQIGLDPYYIKVVE